MEHPSKTDATSSRKKAHFLRLSDELLLEIISQLRYDVYNNRYRQTLRSLALVCRRFHGLAIGHIFEEVSIVSDSQRFSKFRDAIKSNDSLGSLVQRLDIKWSMEMKPERSPQDLMCELPRLQYISVEAWYQSGFNASLFLRPSSPSCFYRLDLTLKSPTASDISDLSLLDGVNGLVLSVLYTFNLPQLERSEAPHTAMLQSFQAKHHTMITLASLQNLLTYPKSLNSLSIWIPGACDESVAAGYDLFTMFDTLSPRSIQQTLSSCAGSLTSLEIQGFLQTFPDHDGTRLSLARFNSLKKAKIASILFSESPIPPIDLYTLLPPSLSDFTITFDMDRKFQHDNTIWLQSLAEHKGTHLPRLASVNFEETPSSFICGTDGPWQRPWSPSSDLKRAFAEADIKLNGEDYRRWPIVLSAEEVRQVNAFHLAYFGLATPLPSLSALTDTDL